ncbi:hypothetical protein EW026_g6322 [Hermanssonia centrifuga]|uniref:Auxin efflux carrier n=1 Tax=Hermanssonia centrifuga TaxID=98765 RepID=A0A4S4KD51_9APHY|nr:hypothetical protein EW026_g6322 [Hermanssonia centrifuga]
MSDSYSSFGATFLGALEGATSLLLTLLTGYCVARVGLIDHQTVTRVSKLCTQLFLPCLIVVQMGPHLTFAPAILKRDSKADGKSKGVEADVEGGDRLAEPVKRRGGNLNPVVQDIEHVGLLQDHNGRSYGTAEDGDDYPEALGLVADEPNVHWPKRLAILEKPVKATLSKMSPPLIGAMVALFIGLIPPLNHIFYDKDSPIHTSATQSAENLGGLFVALQMFLVGSELALIPRARPGVIPTTYALLIRFIVMPGISLLFVWTTAGRGWYADDTLVWFLLVLIPAGPSAMLLASVAELVGIDEGPIAGYLTISYLFSPLMAAICSLGLIVVEKASKR